MHLPVALCAKSRALTSCSTGVPRTTSPLTMCTSGQILFSIRRSERSNPLLGSHFVLVWCTINPDAASNSQLKSLRALTGRAPWTMHCQSSAHPTTLKTSSICDTAFRKGVHAMIRRKADKGPPCLESQCISSPLKAILAWKMHMNGTWGVQCSREGQVASLLFPLPFESMHAKSCWSFSDSPSGETNGSIAHGTSDEIPHVHSEGHAWHRLPVRWCDFIAHERMHLLQDFCIFHWELKVAHTLYLFAPGFLAAATQNVLWKCWGLQSRTNNGCCNSFQASMKTGASLPAHILWARSAKPVDPFCVAWCFTRFSWPHCQRDVHDMG